jgi:hypothetical protein
VQGRPRSFNLLVKFRIGFALGLTLPLLLLPHHHWSLINSGYNPLTNQTGGKHMRGMLLVLFLISVGVLVNGQVTESPGAGYQPRGRTRDYFLGAWKLVSTEIKYPNGRTTPFPDLGSDAVGFLLYTPSGHMCAQLMKPGRPRWTVAGAPTPSEATSALDGFTSYCGTFELREHEQTIVHHPETAWSPNWLETTQARRYHLVSSDRFFFRGTEQEKQKDGSFIPVVWTIMWERLK